MFGNLAMEHDSLGSYFCKLELTIAILGRRSVILMHGGTVWSYTFVIIRWSFLNLRRILVDGRWNLISRRVSILVSERRGILIVDSYVRSLVWVLRRSRMTLVQ